MVRSPPMRGANDAPDELPAGLELQYETPAVEHREPIREPAVLGTFRVSPSWTEADDEEG